MDDGVATKYLVVRAKTFRSEESGVAETCKLGRFFWLKELGFFSVGEHKATIGLIVPLSGQNLFFVHFVCVGDGGAVFCRGRTASQVPEKQWDIHIL